MATPKTTTIGTVQADERGIVTRKQCRQQLRKALEGMGLTCGLLESAAGKSYVGVISNSDVTVMAERKVGAKIVANATKKALKALAVERAVTDIVENDPLDVLGTSDEPEIVQAPESSDLESFSLLSMDEQGRLTSDHPRNGGLSAGAIRAMLEEDGYEVPPKMRKADLVDQLMAIVSGGGTVAPAPETPAKVIAFTQEVPSSPAINF